MIIETGIKKEDKSKLKLRMVQVMTMVLVLAVIAFFILACVTVPYTVEENYSVDNPYTVFVEYNDTEEYTERVPYTVVETYEVEELKPVSTSFYVPGRSTFRVNDDCIVKDYSFNISYVGIPEKEGDFDKRTDYGYRRTSHAIGSYYIGARICNHEKSRLQGRFKACHYIGDELLDCPNWIEATVFPNGCRDYLLSWETPFDEQKSIQIHPIVVSKKLLCRRSSDEEYKIRHLELFRYLGLDSYYYNLISPGETILTDSGVLAQPSRVAKEVEYERHLVNRTRLVTNYRNETRLRKVTKTREETRHSTLEKTRLVTKYRSLWEDWFGK